MFHGVQIRDRSVGWTVDNSQIGSVNNRGQGFTCSDDANIAARSNLWYVGTPARGSLPVGSFYDRFSTWANALFNTGYLSTPGISPILRGARFLSNGDIDPTSNPAFLQWSEPSTEFFGADPYTISFTIVRGDGNTVLYNFNIPYPGNPS
jgi:chitinase